MSRVRFLSVTLVMFVFIVFVNVAVLGTRDVSAETSKIIVESIPIIVVNTDNTKKSDKKAELSSLDISLDEKKSRREVITQDKDDEEILYLMKCVQAEAGNQDITGKRLVAAVILNRVDDERFPDTITEVINQKSQFSVVSNGRINKVELDSETIEACKMEMEERSDNEILYFNNSPEISGEFCYQWGGHWFGK